MIDARVHHHKTLAIFAGFYIQHPAYEKAAGGGDIAADSNQRRVARPVAPLYRLQPLGELAKVGPLHRWRKAKAAAQVPGPQGAD